MRYDTIGGNTIIKMSKLSIGIPFEF